MLELVQSTSFAYGALFPIVNPIGSSLIFLSLVMGSSHEQLNKLAVKISVFSTVMLISVLLFGSLIFQLFGITIPIVLIGGGLLLFFIGWQVLNSPNTPSADERTSIMLDLNADQKAFYPLTMPVTVGPCCIAVVIALGAHGLKVTGETLLVNQIGHIIGIVLIGVTIYICYRYAYIITIKLGQAGAQIILRLAAFINICIGLEIMWRGISYLIESKTLIQPLT